MLIQTTQKLDEQEVQLWGAKKTLNRLADNIKAMVENAPKMSNTVPP